MNTPVKIILDTDIGNDVDDVLALSLLHALQAANECELLGVMVNKANVYAPIMADVINTFYDRGAIPVGVVAGNEPTPQTGPFNRNVVEMCDYNGDKLFHRTHKHYPCAVGLYRKLLSEAKDRSVSIVSIGFLTNLAKLLDSAPDEYSELYGSELIKQKVRLLSVMAGDFSERVLENPRIKKALEYNIQHDVPAARKTFDSWPTEVVFCGYELGLAIRYPASSIENDYTWCEHHPVVECYKLFAAMPYDRPTWDPITALYTVRSFDECFSLSQPGKVTVCGEGYSSFTPFTNGRHRYLICNERQKLRLRKLIPLLCSQPVMKQEILSHKKLKLVIGS